jgi:hypothetical protein
MKASRKLGQSGGVLKVLGAAILRPLQFSVDKSAGGKMRQVTGNRRIRSGSTQFVRLIYTPWQFDLQWVIPKWSENTLSNRAPDCQVLRSIRRIILNPKDTNRGGPGSGIGNLALSQRPSEPASPASASMSTQSSATVVAKPGKTRLARTCWSRNTASCQASPRRVRTVT